MGRRVILCAFSQSVARDMLAVAPLFPLEAELGFQLAEHGDVDIQIVTPEEQAEAAHDVLQIFAREMSKLESRMNFVGYSMLCNQWMLDWESRGTSLNAADWWKIGCTKVLLSATTSPTRTIPSTPPRR